ncbi:type II toxin-antitoxin system RatA family toxin [Streptomyces sp. CB02923]|uniref:type II toxin-antitoxin system RatA family toxin n=1 Tax=Streptomyces sp. CB02923 TaxID=1718985 RepID=UPI0009A12F11|nr:SRPBCC family protein [Streptomyces sp. CB02923]
MRRVELEATVRNEKAPHVLDEVTRWEHYPHLAPHVRTTTVHERGPADGRSSWELHFRSGLLSWTEREEYDRDALRVTFRQTDGDFEEFTGHWEFAQAGDDVRVRFLARFDFGIPSLEGILDPIAERVVRETVAWAVHGLFPDVGLSVPMEPDTGTATGETAGAAPEPAPEPPTDPAAPFEDTH